MRYTRHEEALNFAAHPLLWGLAKAARHRLPCWRIPGLGVVVSDAQMAREILSRDTEFTKNGPGSFAGVISEGLGSTALGNMDGVHHRELRDALSEVLSRERAESIVHGRLAELHTLCDSVIAGNDVDIAHFTRGWAGRIAFDVIGASPTSGDEDAASHELVRRSAALSSVLGFRKPSPNAMRNAAVDREALAALFHDAYRRPAPPQSLIAILHELKLDFASALGLMLIYAIGGTLTLSAALPRILALLIDSGTYLDLVRNPSLISQTVDEGLRFTTPLPGTVRIVRKAVDVSGIPFRANTRLIILTCNLARDPQFFDNAERFDITRVYNPRAGRLWYGAGAHHCAGFSLAQRELKEALRVISTRLPSLRVSSRSVTFGALLPAYRTLQVGSAEPARKWR